MVRTIPEGLKRGRSALYRGQNAYASQTFENDQRAQKLSALLSAYVADPLALNADSFFLVTFSDVKNPYAQSPVLINFARVSGSKGKFICQKDCACEVSASVAISSAVTNFDIQARLVIARGNALIYHYLTSRMAAATNITYNTNLMICPRIIDLQQSDIIYMEVNPGINSITAIPSSTFTSSTQTIQNTSIFIREIS